MDNKEGARLNKVYHLQWGYGKMKYRKVKRPLDKFRIEPWAAWSINEECIVEDNINEFTTSCPKSIKST